MAQLMSPQDVNVAGNVHGGVIMKLIDSTAGVVALRHARTNAVRHLLTVWIFIIPFLLPTLLQ